MAETTPPLIVTTAAGDSCGTVTGLSEVQDGDTLPKNTVPWTGVVAGTNITLAHDATGVTINSSAGGDGDITSVVAGTGLTGGGTEDDVTLNVIGGTGITANADNITTTDGEIVHDNLSGFVANEHTDHTSVDIIAGAGCTGGGDLTADRTINVIAGTGITVNTNDIQTNDGAIVHDNLSGFVATEHTDHTSVDIIAGTGCTGGGDLTADRTINVIGGTGITANANDIATDDSAIVHDNLSGFVANEHTDHTSVDIIAGAGCTGGGDLTSDRTINVIAGTGITVNANDVQTNDGAIVHDNLSGFVANEHTDHTSVSITTGDGLQGGGTIASTRDLSLDIKADSGLQITSGELDLDHTGLAISGCSVGITVPGVNGYASSIEVSNTGDVVSNGDILYYNKRTAKALWKAAPVVFNGAGQAILQNAEGDEGAGGGVEFVMSGANSRLLIRSIHVGNDLSGHADCTVTLDSSASISGCPFPAPFSYLAAGADLGTGVDNLYFGSGVSVAETTMGTDGIAFDSTNGYWNIAVAGWYEVQADISILVTTSPATITNYVVTTDTGYGGTESIKALMYQELRTNIDPHYTMARWMGYLTAGAKLAIKCDTDSGTIKTKRGSSASVKRIG